MNERESLSGALEQLYSTFLGYPLRAEIPGCAHCVTAEAQARIRSKPLRELTGEDLEEYAYSAMNTCVEAYLQALWPFVLTSCPCADPAACSAEDYLRGIGLVIDDLRPFLDCWRRTRSEAALKHLAQLLQVNAWALLREPAALSDPSWKDHPAKASEVIEWLFDVQSREALERAAERGPAWLDETRWADAQQFMQRLRSTPSADGC